MAICGWDSPKQAALYARAANQKRLATDAMPLVDPDYSANESVTPERTVASGLRAEGTPGVARATVEARTMTLRLTTGMVYLGRSSWTPPQPSIPELTVLAPEGT